MRINNNITAINSHRQYGINNANVSKNMEKLSSGFRVNRAADDAAGLAISEKMRAQIRGLNQASRNSQDAVSLVQTAEGGMQTIQNILQRMRELAVQSGNDTNDSTDREALQLEVNALVEEINQIAETTEFNGMALLGGQQTGSSFAFDNSNPFELTIQAGANSGQELKIAIGSMSALGVIGAGGLSDITTGSESVQKNDTLDITTGGNARDSIDVLTKALNNVSAARAQIGAFQNRLDFKTQNLNNQSENVSAAESRIRDADMAKTMTEFTRNNILFQASTAMLAQANAMPQSVLQLLG
jgi:flagellin